MKYDELSKIALSLAAKVLVKAVGVYDLTQLRDMQGVIIAEFLPILRAPEPVDDKGLAEAIKYTQYLSAQGGCEPAPWGPHKQLQLETVLAALRSAQLEVAELGKALGDIAKQKTTDELNADHVALLGDFGVHDFESAYDLCIKTAREAIDTARAAGEGNINT